MRGSLQKKHGKYYLVFDFGIDPETKKRKQKWHNTGTDNKQLAESMIPDIMKKVLTGQYIEPSDNTTKGYLDEWLEFMKPPRIKPRTYDSYKWAIESACKHFGAVPLEELKNRHIDKYIQKKLADGLSPTSIGTHIRVLRSAFKQAVAWEMIYRNPCEAVKSPSKAHYKAKVLTSEQVLQMLDHFAKYEGGRFYLPILLAASTGMRRGEVCGLRWQDVDLDGRNIVVRHTRFVRDKQLVLAPVKTKKSNRDNPVPTRLLFALKIEERRQAANKLRLGDDYAFGDDYDKVGFVWCWDDGSAPSTDELTRHFKTGMTEAGLPVIRFHDLRHTCATLLLEDGVDMKTVSEQLGHSTMYITSDLYAHVTEKMRSQVLSSMDRITQAQPAPEKKARKKAR